MSYNTQDIAQIGKKFSGPTCQFNSPEAEKLLLIYLVINHLRSPSISLVDRPMLGQVTLVLEYIILGVQDFIIIQIGLMPPHGVI